MKRIIAYLFPLLFSLPTFGQHITDMGITQQPDSVMQWFKDSKFGMFIHWGVYSVYGQGEWYLYNKGLKYKDYIKAAYPQNRNYFDANQYDPDGWVKIAQDAGMKYMVLTTRHHDGFCLFDSHFPNSINTQQTLDRDLVSVYVNACRKAHMRVGLYYSVLSWRYPGYFDVTGTDAKPNHFGVETAAWHKQNALMMKKEDYSEIKQLMTQYGQIDDVWWDGGWLALQGTDSSAAYFWEPGKYRDPENKWAGTYGVKATGADAGGRYLGIMGMVRKYQPYILSNSRSGWSGDYANEEGYTEIKGPIREEYWEKCLSLDKNAWGYTFKQNLLTVGEVINYLVNAVIRNGNLLLNVGPDRHGIIPTGQVKILKKVGEWLHHDGESIYGTAAGPWNPTDRKYGFTYKGNNVFIHLLQGYKGTTFKIPEISNQAIACYDVYSKKGLPFHINADKTITINNINRMESKYDTVIELVFRDNVYCPIGN
jgi:alpha-L-fucosidase